MKVDNRPFAPESYWAADPKVRNQVTNGCGPGGWKIDLVPDTIYGLDISEDCNIHDWMYTVGQSLAEKDEADRVLLNNLLRRINAAPGWFNQLHTIKTLRRVRAREYYEAVHLFGGPAYWSGKNPEACFSGVPAFA